MEPDARGGSEFEPPHDFASPRRRREPGLESAGGTSPLEISVSYGQFETGLAVLEAMESFPGAPAIVERAKERGGATIHSPMAQTMDKVLGSWLRDRSGESTPALIQACRTPGAPGRARALIEAGADVEEADVFGWTPLLWAFGVCGNSDSVIALLQAGADPNRGSPEGWTALHAAAQAAASPRVEILLEHGADPNQQEEVGLYAPLFFAAKSGSVESARALLDGGARVRVQDRFGRFPLQSWSVRDSSDREEFVKLMTEFSRLEPLEVSEIELVSGEAVQAELYRKMSVRFVEGILEDGKVRVRASVHFSNPPVDLAFDAFLLAGGDAYPAGSFCGEMAHVERRWIEGVVPLGAGVIHCALRPNAELGRTCHKSGRIFGEELVFPPLSIQIVDEFSR